MNKGIVMEMDANSLIVMTPDGHFERIPRKSRNCGIGEEILYTAPAPRIKKSTLAWASSLVAAVVFCLVLFTGMSDVFADKEVVAYVSMDINPSIEIGIDSRQNVRELKGLNSDGQALIRDLHYAGKKLDAVTAALLERAAPNYLSGDDGNIVIASTVVKTGADLSDEQLSEQIGQQVQDHIAKVNPNKAGDFKVTAFAAPKEVRAEAQAQGLSTGKYAVYLSAKDAGEDLNLDEFKQKSIHDIAKEDDAVGKLLEAGQINKSAIAELLTEEKDGTLDRKQKEKQQEKLKAKTEEARKNDKKGGSTKTPRPTVNTPKPMESTPKPTESTPKPTPQEQKNARASTRPTPQKGEDGLMTDRGSGDAQGTVQGNENNGKDGNKGGQADSKKQDDGKAPNGVQQKDGQDTGKKPEDNRKTGDDKLKQQDSNTGSDSSKDNKNNDKKGDNQNAGHAQSPED